MNMPKGGSPDRDLAVLANWLYGNDEEIRALSKKDAIELSGRDAKWFADNKRILSTKLKEGIAFARLQEIRANRANALSSDIEVPSAPIQVLRKQLKEALERLGQMNAAAAMAHRNKEVDEMPESEVAMMLADIKFLTNNK
jgi:hypothetical protein